MRTLLRLAAWGFAATAALLITVFVAQSDNGQQRLSIAVAAITGKDATKVANSASPDSAQLARLAATETETRFLTQMVRSLNSDRERLLTRLAALERDIEDVTGSIRRQAETTPRVAPPAPAADPALAAPPPTAKPPAIVQPAEPPPAGPPTATVPPEVRVANVVPSTGTADTEPSRTGQPAVGIDIGGAANFDALRALWNSVFSAHAGLLDGLHPVVAVRENSKSRAADLRLLAGPLSDEEAAGRICAALAAARRACRTVAFEGHPLALNAPEQPRRPKAARKAAPQQAPTFPNQ